MENKQSNKNTPQLCPKCKTGQDTYLLDNRSPFCPYLPCHNGKSCSMFVPLDDKEQETGTHPNIIPLQEKAKYKLRAVTYNVTAHFRNDKEPLKSKVSNLIVDDIHNSNKT